MKKTTLLFLFIIIALPAICQVYDSTNIKTLSTEKPNFQLINCYEHHPSLPTLFHESSLKVKTTFNFDNGCKCLPDIDPYSEEIFPYTISLVIKRKQIRLFFIVDNEFYKS